MDEEVVFVPVLSGRSEWCQLSCAGVSLVMRVCAAFVLYYVRSYQFVPLSLIYNSIVCKKSGPVEKCVLF